VLAALLGIEDLATGLPVSKTGTLTAEQTAASQIHSCANSGFARMVRVWASMVLKIETLVGSMLCVPLSTWSRPRVMLSFVGYHSSSRVLKLYHFHSVSQYAGLV